MNAFRPAALLAVLATALVGAGCSSMHEHHAMSGTATVGAAAATRLSAADAAFVAQAAGTDMYEIQASQLALTRGANAHVRNYAQMLVNHHTMTTNELKTILAAKGTMPPAGLPADKQARIANLSRLQGAEFDREYIRITGVQDHQAAIGIFEQASRTLPDMDLRNFATKGLPILRQHLQGAQNIAGTLAG